MTEPRRDIILCIDDDPVRYVHFIEEAARLGYVAVIASERAALAAYIRVFWHRVAGVCLDYDLHGPWTVSWQEEPTGEDMLRELLIGWSDDVPVAVVSGNPVGVEALVGVLETYRLRHMRLCVPAGLGYGIAAPVDWARRVLAFFETTKPVAHVRFDRPFFFEDSTLHHMLVRHDGHWRDLVGRVIEQDVVEAESVEALLRGARMYLDVPDPDGEATPTFGFSVQATGVTLGEWLSGPPSVTVSSSPVQEREHGPQDRQEGSPRD